MVRKMFVMVCAILVMAYAAPVLAGQFTYLDAKIKAYKTLEAKAGLRQAKYEAMAGQARTETEVNDAAEKKFAAGAVVARKAFEDAMAAQDKWLNPLSFIIPPVGFAMAWYNAGEMDFMAAQIMAMRKGEPGPGGCASGWGIRNLLFKVPAGAPECMATYFIFRPFSSRWNQLDYYSVFTEYGLPEWMDCIVIGTKVWFGIAGANLGQATNHARHLHHGHHFFHHGHHHFHKLCHVYFHPKHVTIARFSQLPILGGIMDPIQQSFLWQAAAGGGTNLFLGTINEFFTGAYKTYKPRLDWFNSRDPLPATGL